MPPQTHPNVVFMRTSNTHVIHQLTEWCMTDFESKLRENLCAAQSHSQREEDMKNFPWRTLFIHISHLSWCAEQKNLKEKLRKK